VNIHVQDLGFNEAEVRLAALAAERGVDAPPLMQPNGTVSPQFLEFCKTYGLTLDFIVTGEGPVYRMGQAKTPILQLYRQIRALRDEALAYETKAEGREEDDELYKHFWSKTDKLEEQLMALPCLCPADFAAKAIVESAEGELLTDWDAAPFWHEARALVADGIGAFRGLIMSGAKTKVRELYEEWLSLNDKLAADEEAPDYDENFARLCAVMDEAMAARPQSVADMALKILIADDRGDMSANTWQVALARQAHELAGVPAPQRAAVSTNDPLPVLFREWKQARDGFNATPGDPDKEPEVARLYERYNELIEVMLRTRPTSMAGAAALVDLLTAEEFVDTNCYNGAPSVFLHNLREFLLEPGEANRTAVSPDAGRNEAPRVLLDHIQDMQDAQCTLCGLLDVIARNFPDNVSGPQAEGEFLSLIAAARRQARTVNEGLDAVNLPSTDGPDRTKGGEL
jgi:hypothetical protein